MEERRKEKVIIHKKGLKKLTLKKYSEKRKLLAKAITKVAFEYEAQDQQYKEELINAHNDLLDNNNKDKAERLGELVNALMIDRPELISIKQDDEEDNTNKGKEG